MAQTETKVTLYECDVPTCSKKAAAEDGEAPAGILGTVRLSEHLGGGQAEWYAHAPVHVGKAVKAVLATAGEGTSEPAAPAEG